MAKFNDYKSVDEPLQSLQQRLMELPAYWKTGDFENEMRRFLPRKKSKKPLNKIILCHTLLMPLIPY
ncbi:MAG: hypothetical protein ACI8XG_000495 [Congregibacter sp.]|jgi:hypothetical protein